MNRNFLVGAVLMCITLSAAAGIADLINGVKVGSKLPAHRFDFVQGSSTGNTPRVIDFWATWCGDCRAAIPSLNTLHQRLKARHIDVVGVTQESHASVKALLPKLGINYPIAIDTDGKLYDALKIRTLPYAIAVDATGTIVWRGHPEDIDDKILASLATRR
jgi:thiol-disulfide isomerase/thioredoxin